MKRVSEMLPKETGIVIKVGSSGALRRRIIDMGITPGAKICMIKTAPLGDPIQINVRGYELSIRKSEANKIIILQDKSRINDNKLKSYDGINYNNISLKGGLKKISEGEIC